MAMLPFIGYNIRDYLVHWFRMRKKMSDCPRIFHVNWFRKDEQGKFLWPGFGENMRVLKWIIDRAHGRAYARETLLGWMPRPEDIDLEGLNVSKAQLAAIQSVDPQELKAEIAEPGRAVPETGGGFAEGNGLPAGIAGVAAVSDTANRRER